MKLNIVTTLLFALLLSTGLTTKSSAQEWYWRRHYYAGCKADTAFERCYGHCGRWGYAPRRFYRRMMWWGCDDTAMCRRMGCEPHNWGKWDEHWKEMDADFEKYHKEREADWKKHMEAMEKEEKEWHEHWKGEWDEDYMWGRWRHHWYDNYYYRGGGY